METILYILHVLVCLALLPIILIQPGKGGASAFGGGGAGTVFGSRGANTFLVKLTSGAAILFMLTSMSLSWYASQSRSVVPEEPERPASTAGDDQTVKASTAAEHKSH